MKKRILHYLVTGSYGVKSFERLACNSDIWIPDELDVTSRKENVKCGNCIRTKVFKNEASL